jgi:hypothetical protein
MVLSREKNEDAIGFCLKIFEFYYPRTTHSRGAVDGRRAVHHVTILAQSEARLKAVNIEKP